MSLRPEIERERSKPQVLVARQPIFDARLRVVGYELRFADPDGGPARPSADETTARVLTGSVFHIGLSALVADRLVFLGTSRRFLVEELELPLDPGRSVLQVPADLEPDEELLAGCARRARDGFLLAVQDYDPTSETRLAHLLDLVTYVKIDLSSGDPDLAEVAAPLLARGLSLVATGVTTTAQLEGAARAGISCFQGGLLGHPDTVTAGTPRPTETACFRLAGRFCDMELPVGEVVEILAGDLTLATRVLQVAAIGSASGLRRRIASLADAVVLLGRHRLAGLVTLLLLAGDAERSAVEERVLLAATRARMAELVAEWRWPGSGAEAFLAGMLCSLELLLQRPLARALEELPIEDRIRRAVLGGEDRLGGVLREVLDYERGVVVGVGAGSCSAELLEDAYLDAVAWAQQVRRGASEPVEAVIPA
ncbi:MAG: EAL and HDOD domain-containing protein [Acidimicrobiales bacterium]